MLSHRRLCALAAVAVVLLWGGILVIAAIERRLPADVQWVGHAAVHLWTAANAVAAPVGWLLLASLLLVVMIGLVGSRAPDMLERRG